MSQVVTKPNSIPAIVERDPYLGPYLGTIQERVTRKAIATQRLTAESGSLVNFANAHLFFGLHREKSSWVFREWAPHATQIFLMGDFSDWQIDPQYALSRIEARGVWEIRIPSHLLSHGSLYRLRMVWAGGHGDRIPAYANYVLQDEHTKIFNACVWDPARRFAWKSSPLPHRQEAPRIYEAHVGMAQEDGRVGSYQEFTAQTLPRIKAAGYNTIQLMAVQEHPYYGSFGYQVSSFFAPSSRFGSPDDLRNLVDTAHGMGLAVIMDIVHSHAVKNEVEGLSRFDGDYGLYFHHGPRGEHPAWNTRCFDYGKDEVIHFLLSNCAYWLNEFQFDGFRFDGITSMLYHHRGLGTLFTSYDRYFDESVDADAIVYLSLANELIHTIRPQTVTIAEDVSGMPGLATPLADGGVGFDYRLAMGIPDLWIKLLKEKRDEDWHMGQLWHELTNRRSDEKTISYAESHDQALVGDKTIMFWLADKEMYTHMRKSDQSLVIDRAVALHKMIRLITLGLAGNGYLNFMGNEFGHPEWIDFPREGNNWSFHYARRQWSLMENHGLRYHFLSDFDRVMMDLCARHKMLENSSITKLLEHEEHHVLAFERAGVIFIFNFHPHQSYTDYHVPMTFTGTPAGASLDSIMNTDETRFGGYGLIDTTQPYPIRGHKNKANILVYLPARTGLVIGLRQ